MIDFDRNGFRIYPADLVPEVPNEYDFADAVLPGLPAEPTVEEVNAMFVACADEYRELGYSND